MPVTSKDRGLIAQIAGHIAANYDPRGATSTPDRIAIDAVDLALKVLNRVDVVLGDKEKS
jgi:hypothetical protein